MLESEELKDSTINTLEVMLLLSISKEFCDVTLQLQDVEEPINKLIFSSCSKKILELVQILKPEEDKIFLTNVKSEYFNLFKKFVYSPDMLEESQRDSKEMAKAIITSVLFKSVQLKSFLEKILINTNPMDLFKSIIEILKMEDLTSFKNDIQKRYIEVINTDLFFLVDEDKLDLEEIELLYSLIPKGDKYYYLLDDVKKNDDVGLVGHRTWFIYVTNWFLYSSSPNANVPECLKFLDIVSKYNELCPFEIQNVIDEYRKKRNIPKYLGNDRFLDYMKRIYSQMKSYDCNCDRCGDLGNISDDEEDVENENVFEDYSADQPFDIKELNYREFMEEKIPFKTYKENYNLNFEIFKEQKRINEEEFDDDSKSVPISSLRRNKNQDSQPSSTIYIVGGNYGRDDVTQSLMYFDPTEDSSSMVKKCFINRVGCKAVYKDGKIFIFGGITYDKEFDEVVQFIDISKDDTDTPLKILSSPWRCKRINHSAILINNDVYVVGGYVKDINGTIAKYDLSNMKKTSFPVDDDFCVSGHSLIEYKNSIYIVGGVDAISKTIISSFDPRDRSGIRKLNEPPIECYKSGVVLNNNIITSMGGLIHQNNCSKKLVSNEVVQFDPRANKWIYERVRCINPFYSGGMVQDGEKCFIFGGYGHMRLPQKTVQVYENNEFKKLENGLEKCCSDFGYVTVP
uniref:BTB domain-containing protein n=1 Tax=Parastrongyloides trichosuri TaxID=131310 RepID=A0A0N4Z4M0_PARTI